MKRHSTSGIVIHTTASNTWNTPEDIQKFFLYTLGWSKGGYHVIYGQNGQRRQFYDWKSEATNGILPAFGYSNANVINLSYVGGIKNGKQNEAVCNLTEAQEAMLVTDLHHILKFYPKAKILGHNQINLKGCPSFWVPDWLAKHGLEKYADTRDPYNIKKIVKAYPHPPNFYDRLGPGASTGPELCEHCGKKLCQ